MQNYDRKGISNLLRDYYRLKSRTEFGGEFDTAVVLSDLMRIINSGTLTPRQRQFIALYYFVGLTLDEVAYVTGTSQGNVNNRLRNAFERLCDVSNGESATTLYKYDIPMFDKGGALYEWLDDIAKGTEVGEPSREVVLEVSRQLCEIDQKSSEMVKQVEAGIGHVKIATSGEEYPYYSKEQLRWLDRRVSITSEVMPEGDTVGSQRYNPAPDYNGDRDSSEDNDDYMSKTVSKTGRRKMFKMRGN